MITINEMEPTVSPQLRPHPLARHTGPAANVVPSAVLVHEPVLYLKHLLLTPAWHMSIQLCQYSCVNTAVSIQHTAVESA
jgi:hypothetical protein